MAFVAAAAGHAAAGAAAKGSKALLSALSNAKNNGVQIRSLADLARPARVEPLAIIDQALSRNPFTEELLKFGLSTFTGYYLQAVNMIMNVGKINTLKVFDSLNPERSQGNLGNLVWSTEDYTSGLPVVSASLKPQQRVLVSLESFGGQPASELRADMPTKLHEVDNLAVGKLINVELSSENETVKVPVIIRMVPAVVPSKTLTHIFTVGGTSGVLDRWSLVKAGQISFVQDFIFGTDLIRQHRQALVNDKSGTYEKILDRRRNNVSRAIATGTVSMADASNIAIITKQTAKEIGRAMYGRLESETVRQKLFDNSYLIVLMIVDEDREFVTVYHRDLSVESIYSFKEIKGLEKNKGQDITEIFKSFHQVLGSNAA